MHARPTAETTAEVRLTAGLARTFLTYLRSARENERGGVLLGQFEDWGVAVAGAVFPPQLARARDNCAFDVRDIDTVREAVTGLTDGEITRAEEEWEELLHRGSLRANISHFLPQCNPICTSSPTITSSGRSTLENPCK